MRKIGLDEMHDILAELATPVRQILEGGVEGTIRLQWHEDEVLIDIVMDED